MRTHDPARASLFYHPSCLVDVFFQVRTRKNAHALAAAEERAVLARNDVLLEWKASMQQECVPIDNFTVTLSGTRLCRSTIF